MSSSPGYPRSVNSLGSSVRPMRNKPWRMSARAMSSASAGECNDFDGPGRLPRLDTFHTYTVPFGTASVNLQYYQDYQGDESCATFKKMVLISGVARPAKPCLGATVMLSPPPSPQSLANLGTDLPVGMGLRPAKAHEKLASWQWRER